MECPEHLKYTKEHEWVRIEGTTAVVGITDHAQHQLGDIVYLELPAVGTALERDKAFAVVESVKAVSDIYAPVTGKVVAVNDELVGKPEVINQDPYGEAWLVKIEMSVAAEADQLMSASAYATFAGAEGG